VGILERLARFFKEADQGTQCWTFSSSNLKTAYSAGFVAKFSRLGGKARLRWVRIFEFASAPPNALSLP
jgi:hypothetical protein